MSKTLSEIIRSLDRVTSTRPIQELPRKKRRIKKRKEFDGWTWDSTEVNNKIMNNDKIFIGASDYSDYVYSQLLDKRNVAGKSTFSVDFKVLGNTKKWNDFVKEEFDGDHILQSTDTSGMIITDGNNFIRYNVSSNSINVNVYGDEIFLTNIEELLEDHFEFVTSYIEWVYSPDGQSVNVPLNKERLPIAEMYPFLKGESLESYYDRYLSSSSNILLLIGPPGTGKTTFIRGLLAHNDSSAIVTYDSAILEKDYLFARFIEGDDDVMVLEDSDNFLKARSDGNTMMHRFLNVGDGLVTTKGKKLIFSTNLPSIRDVDPALIRPGRCFDVLNFDALSQKEAEVLAAKLGIKLDGVREKWSIAEVFNKQIETANNKKVGTKMGFV